jgi:hypothetical protein
VVIIINMLSTDRLRNATRLLSRLGLITIFSIYNRKSSDIKLDIVGPLLNILWFIK